jgi:hypothetical protein
MDNRLIVTNYLKGLKMKFKRGQLVVNPNEGYNLYFVMEADYPKMLVYCIESLQSNCKGKMSEVQQKDFVKA